MLEKIKFTCFDNQVLTFLNPAVLPTTMPTKSIKFYTTFYIFILHSIQLYYILYSYTKFYEVLCSSIHIYWSMSISESRSSFRTGELEHAVPRQSPQAEEQSKPCLRHEQRAVLQSVLQLHLTSFKRFSDAGGMSLIIADMKPFSTFHPHSVGTKQLFPHHTCTW